MKRRIIFITIFIMVVGSVLTSLHFSRVETVYSLALKNIEALASSGESSGTGKKATCYTYYVLGSDDIYDCQGQTDDIPKKCKKTALARGYDDYKETCLED